MRPEDLQVNLRPRSSWEAMELGAALLRRHAGAVWRPWLLATLAAFALANAAAWRLGQPWLAGLLLWWLKPAFERIVLYVLSRAVFGRAPGTGEALRAQWRFGAGMLPAYLTWRRLGPARSLLMPVDLLEGNARAKRRARRAVLGGPAYAQASVLTLVCANFELALLLGCVAAVYLFVPAEHLSGALHASWDVLRAGPPTWVGVAANAAAWVAAMAIGPFYVAAGFGLYLNRRSQSEAWDVELAFRRLRERLLARAAPLLLALAAGLPLLAPAPAAAQQAPAPGAAPAGEDGKQAPAAAVPGDAGNATLPAVFGQSLQDDARFRAAAARAYEDPLIGGRRTLVEWRPKVPSAQKGRDLPAWLEAAARRAARVAEWGLWLLLAVLLLVIALTAPRWLPWFRGGVRRPRRAAAPDPDSQALALPQTLPDDIAATVRRLWRQGRQRPALALLYRASVEAMAARVRATLPPGATEAHCLRVSRQLQDEAACTLFSRTVRVWQYAAYAGRLPDEAGFEALLAQSQAQWGWAS
ncbi:DUF4129 domain-containing protein [Pseudoxanthomonas broegbernensis]|uniref:DUF4129 domain-containing protein n=1 Tax=Pseudoxanthomonas broegbernensis TaxID=83619 RepID=A0A7V8K6C4_9GAMM|nr:DUF4129 domain-containing protein [Pseudoxanthomonas broegbernensis]KAF1685689.1 DUF4129 domain-containing protein [Pseudoxanthomonas broegbernensis]MBB6066034.1 hypothetical protein [Pseudoxanthomonas broegbernensis]